MADNTGIAQTKSILRNVMGNYMLDLGKKNARTVVVNADLMGTCRNKSFVEAFPERSFNVGIAEQNLVSFAAGLAHEGFIPYAFGMSQFVSMRACEQVRTDVAYANLPVRFVTTYAGVSGGISGATHWAIEDCAIISAMPNMTVFEPSDATQAQKMLDLSLDYKKPLYIRSSVEVVADRYSSDCRVEVGGSTLTRVGNDGAFLCSGVVVQYALEAAERIAEKTGMQIRVVDMYSIKPIDRNAVISAAKTGRIVVAQDHAIIGGLGSMVAAVIAEEGLLVKFKVLGIPDHFEAMAHAPYLYHKFGYDADGLENSMMVMLKDSINIHGGGYNCIANYSDRVSFSAPSYAEAA